jgi:hypothetical protein
MRTTVSFVVLFSLCAGINALEANTTGSEENESITLPQVLDQIPETSLVGAPLPAECHGVYGQAGVSPGKASPYREVILETGFEESFPPPGWTETQVNLVPPIYGDWDRRTYTLLGALPPHTGDWLGWFSAYNSAAGNQTRLETPELDLSTYSGVQISLWMNHDMGYTAGDRLQIQYSFDGVMWQDAGSPIYRYGQTSWQPHDVDLSVLNGQPSVRVGLLGFSLNGADVEIDDILMTRAMGSIDNPQNLTISILGMDVVLSWSAVANANSYKVYRSANPCAADWGIPVAVVANNQWAEAASSPLHFYKVVASTDTP